MVTATELQQTQNQSLRQGMSDLKVGTCLAIDWVAGTANVNVAGATVDLPMVGLPPIVGARCWVGYLAGRPLVLGAVPRSPFATVNGTPSGGLTAVLADDGETYPVTYDTRDTITIGLRVHVDWDCGGMIIGFPAADPYTGQPVPSGGGTVPKTTRKTVTFSPAWSGTTNGTELTGSGSWGSSNVWCGDSTLGAYGFGNQIDSTIPDAATIVSGYITLGIDGSDYGDGPHLGTHALSSRSGVLSVGNVFSISSGGGRKTLNATVLNALKTGAARGIATAHGGFHIYGAAPGSGAITITWDQ